MIRPTLAIAVFLSWCISFTGVMGQQKVFIQQKADFSLVESAFNADTLMVLSLLELGADPNAAAYDGTTALMYAVMVENYAIVEILLEAGADPNLQDSGGMTALFYALIAENQQITDLFLLLVEDINQTTSYGFSALTFVAQTGNIELVERLLAMEAIVDMPSSQGVTPLMYAAAFGHFFMVDLLVFHGAQVNHQAEDGSTPLHMAAWYGHEEIAGLLLDLGALLDMPDHAGNTPLAYAVLSGTPVSAWYLIESGASLTLINDEGFTPLAMAAGRNDIAMAQLISAYDFLEPQVHERNKTAFARAIYSKNPEMIGLVRNMQGSNLRGLFFSDIFLGAAFEFNGNDLMYQFYGGLFEARYRMKLELSFAKRMGRRVVQQIQDVDLIYQFREDRWIGALKLQRELFSFSWRKNESGFQLGGMLLYSDGYYNGTAIKPPSGLAVAPAIDVFYRYNNVALQGGYYFYRTGQTSISPHRFKLGILVNIPLFSKRYLQFNPIIR